MRPHLQQITLYGVVLIARAFLRDAFVAGTQGGGVLMMVAPSVGGWRVWATVAVKKGAAGAVEVVSDVLRVWVVEMEAGVGAVGGKLALVAALSS